MFPTLESARSQRELGRYDRCSVLAPPYLAPGAFATASAAFGKFSSGERASSGNRDRPLVSRASKLRHTALRAVAEAYSRRGSGRGLSGERPQAGAEEERVAHEAATRKELMTERTSRVDWAELLRRTFDFDVLACVRCGGRRRVLASVKGARGVRAIVEHLNYRSRFSHAVRRRA